MADTATKTGGQGNTDTAGKDAAGKTGGDGKPAGDKKAADAGAAADGKGGKAVTDPDAEAKAEADRKAAENKGGDGGESTGAPAKYELKLSDEGAFDESDLAAFETIARENNLTNEQAQAAIDREGERLKEQSANFAKATKADKVYGGDNLETTQKRADAVINLVRPASHPRAQAFRRLLEKSGYGNHIEIVSFLADLGKLTEEDGPIGGSVGGKKVEKAPEEVLYGKS